MRKLFVGIWCVFVPYLLSAQSDTLTEQLHEIELKQSHTIHKTNSVQHIDLRAISETSRSLLTTLNQISGFHLQSVGNEQKPIIRDMNTHRVTVLSHSTRIQGQDWGNDHGIDLNDVGQPKLVSLMGAPTLLYNTHSVLGLINTSYTPHHSHNDFHLSQSYHQGINMSSSEINLGTETTNWGKYFMGYKFQIAQDREVNDSEGNYLSFALPLEQNTVNNTASEKHQLLFYWVPSEQWENTSQLSYTKVGFFSAGHGVPNLEKAKLDYSRWNIDLPRQEILHYNQTVTHKWRHKQRLYKTILNFQHNIRQEFSEFFTHYPMPDVVATDLEYDMRLTSLQFKELIIQGHHQLSIDLNQQVNTIGGYSFFIPEYQSTNWGVAYMHTAHAGNWKWENGLRAEQRWLNIEGHFDQNVENYLRFLGQSPDNVQSAATQSVATSELRFNMGASSSLQWKNDQWTTKLTTAYISRLPHPVELSVNGVHHGAFRHEQGDPNLDNEQGVNLSYSLDWAIDGLDISLLSYHTLYSNYVFLNPSGLWSYLPEQGQVYTYVQSAALHRGTELDISYTWSEQFKAKFSFEYLQKHILNEDFNLDKFELMTPPMQSSLRIDYSVSDDFSFYGRARFVAQQDEVAPSEDITDGYQLYGMGLQSKFTLDNSSWQLNLSVDNLLNTAYLDHTSFLKQIQIGELGRRFNVKLNMYL